MALPSLAAAQVGAVGPAPAPSTDAAGAVAPSTPTDATSAAVDAPSAIEGEQPPAAAASEVAAPTPQTGADSPSSSRAAQTHGRPAPTRRRADVSAADDTDIGADTSSESTASAGWDAEAMPAKLKFHLGGMPRVHAGLGTAIFRHRDAGFALFTAETWTTGVAASAGVDIFRLGERWLLSADADWWREVHRSVGLFGGFGASRFNAHTLGLGGSLRYRALDWCQPYVHVWGGFASVRATLSVPSIDYASDNARQYLPAFGAALGATVWGPVLGRDEGKDFHGFLSLGLRAEAGYQLTGAFDFAYDLRGAGNYPIAVYEPTAGTLRLDAPYIRLLVMLGAA
jgi:hypothetical protein